MEAVDTVRVNGALRLQRKALFPPYCPLLLTDEFHKEIIRFAGEATANELGKSRNVSSKASRQSIRCSYLVQRRAAGRIWAFIACSDGDRYWRTLLIIILTDFAVCSAELC
jgi:hypothetical protein